MDVKSKKQLIRQPINTATRSLSSLLPHKFQRVFASTDEF
jgi:hypothetical protein